MDCSAHCHASPKSDRKSLLNCVLKHENIEREDSEEHTSELQARSGVAVATLARIEAGGYDPRLSTLKKLAKTLGVTVGELIGEKSLKKGG